MVLHLEAEECSLKGDSSNNLSFAPAEKETIKFMTLKNINPCQIYQVFITHVDAVKITVSFQSGF